MVVSLFKSMGWLLLGALALASVSAWLHPKAPAWSREAAGVPEVTAQQVGRWTERVLLVDARGEAAYRRGHLPGAILLNEDHWDDLLPEFLAQWQPGRPVVVYCDLKCGASHEVARRLRRELALENLFVLKDGRESWSGGQTP